MAEAEDGFNDLDVGDTRPLAQCADIVARLVWHFLGPIPDPDQAQELHRRIRLLGERGRQNEKWFVAEMMSSLEDMKMEGKVVDWFPEAAYDENVQQGAKGNLKCDLVLKLPGAQRDLLAGVEVKVASVGRQRSTRLVVLDGRGNVEESQGQRWDLDFILTEGAGDNGGVLRDALRLSASEALDERVCLVFAYGDPERTLDPHTDEFARRLSELGTGRFEAVMLGNCSGQVMLDRKVILQAFTCLIRPVR